MLVCCFAMRMRTYRSHGRPQASTCMVALGEIEREKKGQNLKQKKENKQQSK